MNDLTIPPEMQSATYSAASELAVELGKMLALVAPSSMTAEQQELWLCSAVDSLQGIRATEVRAVSAEVRRSVTRHNQIVPAIAEKVAEHRKRSKFTGSGADVCRCGKGTGPFSGRTDIHWVRDGSGTLMIETCDPTSV